MSQQRPHLHLDPDSRLTVTNGEEFTVSARVENTTNVIDAFEVFVLGVDADCCTFHPAPMVALFPDGDETVEIRITLPADFPAGETKLWIKASSQAEPSIDVVQPLPIFVQPSRTGAISMFPTAVVARNGRFGVTVHNTGNAPMNATLETADAQNAIRYEVLPASTQRIAAGSAVSFQAVLRAKRPLVGAAVPIPFTIVPQSDGVALVDQDGQAVQVDGTFAPKPLLPTLLVAFAGAVALLALWAVVVGAAIDAIVDDGDQDLADSIETGMNAVADRLSTDEDAAAAAAAAAQADVVTADADGTPVAPDAQAGLSGEAVGVTSGAANQSDDAPPMEVAPNELAGVLAAASTGDPIPGGTVTVQPLLAAGNFEADGVAVMAPDPNRPRIEAVSNDQGVFRIPGLLPGAYDVTVAVPGYAEISCENVSVPAPTSTGTSAFTRLQQAAGQDCIVAGQPFSADLSGAEASIAGIVTVDGSPLLPTAANGLTVTLSRLEPVEGTPEGSTTTSAARGFALQVDEEFPPRTQSGDAAAPNGLAGGRFSFVMAAEDAATPGTFELVVSANGYSQYRQVVQLAAGQKSIGLQAPLVPPLPTATPPEERVLSGTVLDGSDDPPSTPLVGASVSIVGPSATYAVATDAAGMFELQGVPVGSYALTIELDDYLTASVQRTVPAGSTPPEPIVLDPAPGTLSGAVRDSVSGFGIAGVAVTIEPPPPVGDATVTTDVDGRYQFTSLGPGSFEVTYANDAYTTVAGIVQIAPNQDRSADIVLERIVQPAPPPTAIVTGIVEDFTTGLPLDGVEVLATPAPAGTNPQTTSASGWFRFDALDRETDYTLELRLAGYATANRTIYVDVDEPVSSSTVSLVPVGSISGRVTNGGGFTVSVSGPGGSHSTVTNRDGDYSIVNLAPGVYSATFSKDGFVPDTYTMDVVGEDPIRPLVTLGPIIVPPPTAGPTP